jgi:hypothetical protein
MNLDQFVALHNEAYLDYDGKYGAQCVDLIDYYIRDVLEIPIVWVNGAIDWYGKDNPYLEWFANTPTNYPPKGAIMVWHQDFKVGTGIFGHIAIALDATTMAFHSFDQNWPPNSPCHVQYHTYEGVTGWGVPRAKPPPPNPAPVPGPGTGAERPGANLWSTFIGWLRDFIYSLREVV